MSEVNVSEEEDVIAQFDRWCQGKWDPTYDRDKHAARFAEMFPEHAEARKKKIYRHERQKETKQYRERRYCMIKMRGIQSPDDWQFMWKWQTDDDFRFGK